MTEPRTGRIPQSLLEAARRDGPGATRRSRIWEGVAMTPHLALVASAAGDSLRPGLAAASGGPPVAGAAGASLASAVAASAAFSAGKLVLAGAIAGSLLTVGLGAILLRGPLHERASVPAVSLVAAVSPAQAGVPSVSPAQAGVRPVLPPQGVPVASVTPAPEPVVDRPLAKPASTAAAKHQGASRDVLMREVALVGEARSAIVRGEAASALALLDAADQSKSRSLQPEELALRARAFRALGRSAEAMQVEEQLRTRYPDSFLAR